MVVSPDTPDLATTRGWRASLTSLHAESRSRTKRLTDLAAEVNGLTPMQLDLRIVEGEISTADKELAGTESNLHKTTLAAQVGQQRLTALNSKYSELQRTAATLDWIRRTKPVYAQLTEQIGSLRAQLALATDALAGRREALAILTAEAGAQGRADAVMSEDLQAKRAHLARARELAASLEVWRASRAALEMNWVEIH